MSKVIKLTDAGLDAVAAGGGDIDIGEISQSNNTLAIGVVAAGGGDINIGKINQSNNTLAIEAIEGAVVGNINITNFGDKIAVGGAGQELVIGDITFNFDDSVSHLEFTGFKGAGVDGGHVITFQGGANDVAVTEHDGHTTLSNGDLALTVDAVGLAKEMDWFLV